MRSAPNRGNRGKLKVKEEEFECRYQCKRQLEGAEGEGGARDWVEDAAVGAVPERTQQDEAARRQQQRQHLRRSRVQQREASEGATREPASEEAPLQGVHAAVSPEECGA